LEDIKALAKGEAEEQIQAIAETTAINVEQVGSIFERFGPTDIKGQYRTNL